MDGRLQKHEPMPLRTLCDRAAVRKKLRAGGLDGEATIRQADVFVHLATTLRQAGVDESRDAYAFFVPGRIEVLGKHTDYAGGSSLVCTVQRGFCLIATARSDRRLYITDAATGDEVSFELSETLAPPPGSWSTYPMTVAQRVARNFPGALRGGHLAFSSDLPQAAGMSSSSAFLVAVFLALSAFNNLPEHAAYRQNIDGLEALAQYLGTVENGQTFGTLAGDRGVGTFGGSQDHTAILCSEPGRLCQFAYGPVRRERSVHLPQGYLFAVGSSGVAAQKTGAAREQYNRASLLASSAAAVWRAATGCTDPHLGAAVANALFTSERMREALRQHTEARFSAEALVHRFEHFLAENTRILPAAVEALEAGDLEQFGRLVDRSQQGAAQLLKNQIDETICLAREARRLGAVAASAFGAGFGGSVWALVPAAQAEMMTEAWSARYGAAFHEQAERASFFLDQPGPAAFQLSAL